MESDCSQEEVAKRAGFWRRRVATPLRALLLQGASPEKLALAVAMGFTVGVFPILGTTTMMTVVLAAVFRLNQAATQVGNAFSSLPYFLLLVPFVRLGEFMTGAEPFPLDVGMLRETAREGFIPMLKTFGEALACGILGWAVALPFMVAAVYFACLPLIRRFKVRR